MRFTLWGGGSRSRTQGPLLHAKRADLFLAAFGKHPGWDDHIDDIGLVTKALVAAKQVLYVDGIGKIIDSSAWEKLSDKECLAGFDHSFYWFGGEEFLLGRIWSSSDRKGRTKYPMIACVEMHQWMLEPKLRWLSPELDALEKQCRQYRESDEIVRLMIEKQAEFQRQLLKQFEMDAKEESAAACDRPFVRDLLEALSDEAICRTMYGIESQLGTFPANRKPVEIGRSDWSQPVFSQHLRLPAFPAEPIESLLFWRENIELWTSRKHQLLFLCPHTEPWLDAIVGCPTSKELFCLRASSLAIPVMTEIPYKFPAEFRAETMARLENYAAAK